MQIEQQEGEQQPLDESDAYSLFLYAVRSQITRDYYLRRLRIFFNHINLLPVQRMDERCNSFAEKDIKDPNWTFNCFVRYTKQPCESTINYLKTIRP
jgi:hypothetical protein